MKILSNFEGGVACNKKGKKADINVKYRVFEDVETKSDNHDAS